MHLNCWSAALVRLKKKKEISIHYHLHNETYTTNENSHILFRAFLIHELRNLISLSNDPLLLKNSVNLRILTAKIVIKSIMHINER